ncbi:hypothetical protein AGABI2DRAFT_70404 [Agaricus bisporus var. bisporus H97]|uniref:hypothetical protein n=1 Tax=Agaricus bisporus var. bisporus (strain H97 / ATCC MYA-4626 / FGSC 10389) TaxID=936046 RepID=UPI00029F5289|nr:hypothetical protein AGABI2DRAFT_70404 [Agaricus bisporus var. bisporus H97]EKV47165.1 hypothetical protein AGABI2DRAFT_70404 [Agaricus bisporus var. bisporus H97]
MFHSIHSLKNEAERTWNDPTLSSFLLKEHDRITLALQPDKTKSSRSIRGSYLPAPDALPAEARVLHENINDIQLSSWVFPLSTSAFVRTSKNSDQNAFERLKFTSSRAANVTIDDAIVVIAVYNKVSWNPSFVARLSQHAFLSSQTLQDVCRAIPCAPYATQVSSHSSVQTYEIEDPRPSCNVICIEGEAYGEGGEDDHSRASGSLRETRISSLSLRVNEPYWMLHQGNCEHYFVIEQIRILHPSDSRSGYPITLQQTPQPLDICRACEKSPAVWSIVNDDRLGESPSFLCDPCWSNMGLPVSSENERIEVIPLLVHIA